MCYQDEMVVMGTDDFIDDSGLRHEGVPYIYISMCDCVCFGDQLVAE
jgi:hypothetical protein